MYNNNNRFNRGRGGFRGGGRRIKTFDPSNIVDLPPAPTEKVNYEIKNNFIDFDISDNLKRNVLAKGYKIPTPIQDQSIPEILNGRDLIGIANTGTGKTAAFLIPLIDKALKNRNERILIMTPTRELASQIRDELIVLSRGLPIYSALCIGGANIGRQRGDLRRNPNFVIGTPGRLIDLIETRSLNLNYFTAIVMDEADRMVDMGFINDISYIISLLPTRRQSLFFSATVDEKIKSIIRDFTKNPVTVSVKSGDITAQVKQEVIKIFDRNQKIEKLHELLIKEEFEKVLIFGRTKYGVQDLADELYRRGFKADAIHGNKNQNQRQRVIEKFKSNFISILIATDVASRGLDIPNVSHVINYDLPESYETYIHRIGRTGRADKKGTAITFVG